MCHFTVYGNCSNLYVCSVEITVPEIPPTPEPRLIHRETAGLSTPTVSRVQISVKLYTVHRKTYRMRIS